MGYYLEGHSSSPRVMIPATRAFHQTARSGAQGFRSHRLRSLLVLCGRCFISVLPVKAVDVTGAIEFLEKARLDELRWIRCLRRGQSVAHVFEDRLEPFHGRVGLGSHDFTQGLIGFVQLPLVGSLSVLRKRPFRKFRVGPDEMD